MQFTLLAISLQVLPLHTRFPFQYGIASLSAMPQLYVCAELEIGHQRVQGIACEALPPKWFSKDPALPYEVDLAEMLASIQNARRIALDRARSPCSFFSWWQDLYAEQHSWASVRRVPGLLAQLGLSLIERALLSALSQHTQLPIHQLLLEPELGIDLTALRPGADMRQALAPTPQRHIYVRHTIGLADPLDALDTAQPLLADGLPHSLEQCISRYDLRYFKIKLSGHAERDFDRLAHICRILTQQCQSSFHCTLDANEQFHSLEQLKAFYEQLQHSAELRPLLSSLLWVEQPLHRDLSLQDELRTGLRAWKNAPALIIDESDADLHSLPRALELGYSGTSYKSCKGILKGLANAALIRSQPHLLLSGEDLSTTGPVALLQDLSMMAALGIAHVERNGHHYFKGLSAHPQPLQQLLLQRHSPLFEQNAQGYSSLKIHQSQLDLHSLLGAAYGDLPAYEHCQLEPLNDWIKRGGMSEFTAA
jgi:L-alanine-DL-glutamate epimerase-like enolase superfamily enzyme